MSSFLADLKKEVVTPSADVQRLGEVQGQVDTYMYQYNGSGEETFFVVGKVVSVKQGW